MLETLLGIGVGLVVLFVYVTRGDRDIYLITRESLTDIRLGRWK